VTGSTGSANFPTRNPFQATLAGKEDAFVTSLDITGTALAYSTYLGGSGWDIGYAIAVDSSGSVYVAGETSSTDFPTRNPFQAAKAGSEDAFVARLDPSDAESLLDSSYLGGSGFDSAFALTIGTHASFLLGMCTTSNDLPDLPGRGLHQKAPAGRTDAFIAWMAFGSTLTVAKSGTGSGTVTSSPSGIDCGSTCSATYNENTLVTLTATPATGSTFTGWSGGCTGTGTCTLTMTGNLTTTAIFGLETACTYSSVVNPKNYSSPKAGTVTLTVKGTGETKTTACPDPAITISDTWMIPTTSSGWTKNKKTVKISITQNGSSSSRSGSITVADTAHVITQKGAPCTITKFTPTSQSVPVTGNSYTFRAAVTPQDCSWQAASNKAWIEVTTPTGTGTGNVGYTVPANTTKKTQSGAITVTLDQNKKKKSITVRQAGK
jgi:hypothetical protein